MRCASSTITGPSGPEQPGQNLLALRQVERRDHPVPLEPLIHAELVADVLALEDEDLAVNFSFSSRCHWKARFAGQRSGCARRGRAVPARDEQARHDGLARAGVVGQQEPHACELEQVLVDRLSWCGRGSTREIESPK